MSIINTVRSALPGAKVQMAARALGIFRANGIAVRVCGRQLNDINSLDSLVRDFNESSKYSRVSKAEVMRNLITMGTEIKAQEIAFLGFNAVDAAHPWDHVRFASVGIYKALTTLLIVKRGPGLREYLHTEKKFFHWANCARTPVEKGFVIKILLDTIRQHDEQTADHEIGTLSLTSAVAREMGLSEEEISQLELDTLLHDIGKVGVPKYILHKAGNLTKNEWEQLRMHVKVGVYLLEKINWLPTDALDAVLFHHYYKKYPKELDFTMTPLSAKILAVTDSFDVMTTGRRKEFGVKRTPRQALRELEEDLRYDTAVVRALRNVIKKVGFGLIHLKKTFEPSEWFGLDPREKFSREQLRRTLF